MARRKTFKIVLQDNEETWVVEGKRGVLMTDEDREFFSKLKATVIAWVRERA